MSRLPGWPQLASEDFLAIQAEQMALRTMRIRGDRARDSGGLTRESEIKVVKGSWTLRREDGRECRAESFLGLGGQATGDDRWIKLRELGIEIVWYG